METTPEKDSNVKILWVEDDYFLNDIIAQRMSNENYALLSTNNGNQALSLAKSKHPKVILLDILLAGMDGIEILRHLKEDAETKDIPVLMFSNLSDVARQEECKKLGAAGFFVKADVTLDDILISIKKLAAAP